MESCDSIFDTKKLSDYVPDWFPFIESIFFSLVSLPEDAEEMVFSKVETPASFLPGYYDFSFNKVNLQGESFILWEIYDYTSLYEDFRQYQQKRNELEIQRQILALRNKNLTTKNDILKRENLLFEASSKTGKKNTPVITPFNALDLTTRAIGTISGDEKMDHVELILDLSIKLGKIAGELNRFGEPAELPEEPSLFNLVDETRRVADALESEGDTPKNSILVLPEANFPNLLIGKKGDITRIITGLYKNVLTFSSKGEIKVGLFSKEAQKGRITVSIMMEGGEHQERKPDIKEVILRLATVRKLVEFLGGELILGTEKEFGARAGCYLPMQLP